jgi:hypothetical protein
MTHQPPPIFSGPLSGIAAGVDISLLLGAVVYLPFARLRTADAI